MQTQQTPRACTAAPATQNAGETVTTRTAEPFGLRAMWLHFANQMELRRLAKLHLRIERKKAALADLITERQTIMNRCIRRMRRAQGKN